MKRLALLLAVATSLTAQVREKITVNLVEVPVVVSRGGQSVLGLQKDDFELFVNGRPQTIDYFDVIESTPPQTPQEAATPAPVSLSERRLILLMFDFAASGTAEIWRARGPAERLVGSASPNDVFSVAVFTPAKGVEYLVPFTNDRVAVLRAIRTLTPSSAGDGFGIATLAAERGGWDSRGVGIADATIRGVSLQEASAARHQVSFLEWFSQRPVELPDGQLSTVIADSMEARRESDAAYERAQSADIARRLTDGLSAVADLMAPLEGLKQVVLLSEGKEIFSTDAPMDAVRMHARFKKAGVMLNAIDIGGLRSPLGTNNGGAVSEGLYALALDTGGYVVGNIGLNRAFELFEQRQKVTYVLSFRPTGPQKDYNEITVKLRGGRLFTEVQHRRGYSLDPGRTETNPLFLADVMLNDIPQNGVTMSVNVKAAPGKADVRIAIPGQELLTSGKDGKVLLDSFVYVFDEQRAVAGWSQKRVALDLDKGRAFLETGPYVVEDGFKLAPGKYVAKVLMRVAGDTGRTGLARAEFVVAQD